jgi:hypothetical protein
MNKPMIQPVHCRFASSFDSNGVLYYIGTDGLSSQYKNPSGNKVAVSWSSKCCGSERYFVSHESPSGFSMTDSCIVGGEWMMLDLSIERSLVPRQYWLCYQIYMLSIICYCLLQLSK